MADIEEKLKDILARERKTVDEWLARDDAEFSDEVLRKIAERNQAELDALPADAAGRIKALEKYEFLNPDAQRDFIELLNRLRKAMTQTFFKNVEDMVRNLSDGDIARMKEMLNALHDMLVRKIAGEDPGFRRLHAGIRRHVRRQPAREPGRAVGGDAPPDGGGAIPAGVAVAGSTRRAAVPAGRPAWATPELEAAMRKLAKAMDFLEPRGARYRFGGDEELDPRSGHAADAGDASLG